MTQNEGKEPVHSKARMFLVLLDQIMGYHFSSGE